MKINNIELINPDFDYIPRDIKITGVSFRQNFIFGLENDTKIKLQRDNFNKYDKFAIKVIAKDNEIGWIPKTIAEYLAREIDMGIIWNAKIKNIYDVKTDDNSNIKGVEIHIDPEC